MAGILRAITGEADAGDAVRALARGLLQPDCCLVLLFVSPSYDMAALAVHLASEFAGVQVAGCTTSGEIGPGGYADQSITGVSFAGGEFAASVGLIEAVSRKDVADMQARVRRTRLAIYDAAPWARHENLFALSLMDGVCGCEELVVSTTCGALAGIPLRGGSAGDGLNFARTYVLHEGMFRRDCALIVVMATRRAFRAFKTEHFSAGAERVVVTGADPRRRVVTEIDAVPAVEAYGRITGFAVSEMTPALFATRPLVVRVGEQIFVRSIQRMNDDLSLTFFSAIDEGAVLTVGSGGDLVANLQESFAAIEAAVGRPELVLGFDCILRGLELEQLQRRHVAGALMDRNNVVGFSTYGEQYDAMHVNQTLTGVAIGAAHG